jgi:hypothetical protein
MNLLLQLKQPIIDGDGMLKIQVAGEFYIDDENAVANTAFGVMVIRREDIGPVAMVLPDEFDRSSLEDRPHILVLN